MLIFEDCNLEKEVDDAICGCVFNAGQICSASKRFVVQNSIKEAFARRLVEKLPRSNPEIRHLMT